MVKNKTFQNITEKLCMYLLRTHTNYSWKKTDNNENSALVLQISNKHTWLLTLCKGR